MALTFKQIRIVQHLSMFLICGLLFMQPAVEVFLLVNDTSSIIDSDMDGEKEVEEKTNKELEKEKTLWSHIHSQFSNQDLFPGVSKYFTQNHWISHSQDILIPPPEFVV
jgi:predicted acetyltransferase